MSDTERVETPEVSFSLSGETLTLRDEAGGGEVLVELDGDTSLTRATTAWFDVPMDAAVSFEVAGFCIPYDTAVWLRGADGESHGGLTEQPSTVNGETFVDISAAMKVVAYVEGGTVRGYVRRDPGSEAVFVEFDEPTQVVLGARSVHEEPTATMTIPEGTDALRTAVSLLGSSMKEWSAERSWPTLRGHPPAIRLGDELDVPDRLSQPDTGITVAVPDTAADTLRVAPLAHYFGADVVVGQRPELRLDVGYTEPLGTGRALEASVDELLARGFLLDSLVRIGGYYSLHRREYEELAPELPFYPPDLYDASIDEQLLEYLEVSFAELEPYVPQWSTTATLRSAVSEAAALPHLLDTLSRIHVTPDGRPVADDRSTDSVTLSSATRISQGVGSLPNAVRGDATSFRRIDPADARVSFIGVNPTLDGGFERVPWEQYDIPEGPPAPEYRQTVSRSELRDLFRSDPVFVHYGNPVTPDGFVCSDGILPFEALPSANGGVASFAWSGEETAPVTGLLDAVEVGYLSQSSLSSATVRAFAKYLLLGYSPVQAAQFVGRGGTDRFVGEASLSVASHADGHPPPVITLERTADGYRAEAIGWRTRRDWLGTAARVRPDPGESEYTLMGSCMEKRRRFSLEDLRELAADDYLLRFDGDTPEEIPAESVIHASREDWGSDTSEHAPADSHRESVSDP